MSELDLKDTGGCRNCGEPAHEHEKEKVRHGNGMWSWDYYCPVGA